METNTNLFLTVNAKKYPSADAVAKVRLRLHQQPKRPRYVQKVVR